MKNEVDKLKELRDASKEAGCENFPISLTEVVPRSTKSPRFIRASFLSKDDRWNFNDAFNALQCIHGFTVGSIDPHSTHEMD